MNTKSTFRLTALYSLPLLLIITALFVVVLVWEERHIASEQTLELRETANALVQLIIVTRRWNAEHDGVYVQVSDKTPPNPYLDDPQRDIVSRAGKHYTKLNPAYMTREISELAKASQGYQFRLASTRPLNPANRADPWEAEALRDFERGAVERMSIETGKGGRVYRFMRPLRTEAPCLDCHAKQGYHLNDIRGGISVTFPLKTSDHLYNQHIRTVRMAASALWLCMTTFIVLASFTLSRKVSREIARDMELSNLRTTIELAGAAAHEIRQPLTVIVTYAEIIKQRAVEKEALSGYLNNIAVQCRRIDETLAKMQNITAYKTKSYVGEGKIVDLDESTEGRGDNGTAT